MAIKVTAPCTHSLASHTRIYRVKTKPIASHRRQCLLYGLTPRRKLAKRVTSETQAKANHRNTRNQQRHHHMELRAPPGVQIWSHGPEEESSRLS